MPSESIIVVAHLKLLGTLNCLKIGAENKAKSIAVEARSSGKGFGVRLWDVSGSSLNLDKKKQKKKKKLSK